MVHITPRALRRGGFSVSSLPCRNYFFCTYLRQSIVTADRMMIPENTN